MRFDLSQSGLKNMITAGIFSLVAIGILLNWAVPVSAQNAAPAKPDTPTLRALHQGMVEVDWNDVSGANRYEVQFYTSSGWIDLPNAGLGIEIFFDGSRAVATGLPEDLGYDAFRIRAGNSGGWSEWSEYAWQMTTHNMDWEGIPVPTIEPTPEPVNTPATGAPTISRTAEVGDTLTAETSGINDADGLTNVSYSYQWVRNDGTGDSGIKNATATTYTLVAADEGQTIKVMVSFADDAGNDERLTSAATGEVEARPNRPATGVPNIIGTAQVGETLTADTTGIADADGLTNVSYGYQWIRNDGTSDTYITGAADSSYTLAAADEGKTIKVRVSFTDDDGHAETLTSTATEAVSFAVQQQTANSPATGAPTIIGTAQVGETLTADPTGIADADGLSGATFAYQWISNDGTADTDIQDATGSTYTLVSDDEDQTLKVRVSFADDLGNDESLTSAATAAVAAEDPQPQELPAKPTGLTGMVTHNEVSLSWDNPGDETITGYQILRRDKALHQKGVFLVHVNDTGNTDTTYVDESVEPETKYVYRIKAKNIAGLSERSNWFNATTPTAPDPNSPATGVPTIAGTAQVGETLTANTSGIADDDGLNDTTFIYQWVRSTDGTNNDITDATDSTYTLVAADEGSTIKVQVSFNDDDGHAESLTSTATAEVAAAPRPPKIPRNLRGTANADGTVTLSWDVPNDDSVTGYQIMRRSPTQGEKNLMVYVDDTGSAATEYTDNNVVPNERYAYRVKAINAVGFSIRSEFVNVTPTQPAEPEQNIPATGMPTISGTARVGKTLTADTSDIADADGLNDTTFTYQWVRSTDGTDTDIADATDSTYTLVGADRGKNIKVRVSFTDDNGHAETLTSTTTEAVWEWVMTATLFCSYVDWDNPNEDCHLRRAIEIGLYLGRVPVDADESTVDYVLRIDIFHDDGTDANECEGENMGVDIVFTTVEDEDVSVTSYVDNGSCAEGQYSVLLMAREGDSDEWESLKMENIRFLYPPSDDDEEEEKGSEESEERNPVVPSQVDPDDEAYALGILVVCPPVWVDGVPQPQCRSDMKSSLSGGLMWLDTDEEGSDRPSDYILRLDLLDGDGNDADECEGENVGEPVEVSMAKDDASVQISGQIGSRECEAGDYLVVFTVEFGDGRADATGTKELPLH